MRKVKLQSRSYDGTFYDMYEGDVKDIRTARLEDLIPTLVDEKNLIQGGQYLIKDGSTVKYLGDGSYEILDLTPLYANDNILNLNGDLQHRLFWKLVKNCKNGTHFGI